MMLMLSFLLTAAILILEGVMVAVLCLGRPVRWIHWTLAYPLALVFNVTLLFLLYFVEFPLTTLSLSLTHLAILAAMLTYVYLRPPAMQKRATDSPRTSWTRRTRLLAIVSLIILAAIILSAAVYVLVLPTYYWDSLTHWYLRTKIMLQQHTLIYENVGAAHYPHLLNATHFLFLVPHGWQPNLAKASTFLLSLTAIAARTNLVQRTHGLLVGIVSTTLLATIPLVAIHLQQGYADSHLASYMLLSALTLAWYWEDRRLGILCISAILCAGAMRTKVEGMYLAALPWCLLVVADGLRHGRWKHLALYGFLPFLVIVWQRPFVLLARDLPFSPNGFSLEWHPEALSEIWRALFLEGSYGVHWWVLLTCFIALAVWKRRRIFSLQRGENVILMWGLAALGMTLATYLFTGNVTGLLRRSGFLRVMLSPTILLLQAIILLLATELGYKRQSPSTQQPTPNDGTRSPG